MKIDLSGKVAFITGASRGIGYQIAETLGLAGAIVLICSRNEESLNRAYDRLSSQGIVAEAVKLDVTDQSRVSEKIRAAIKQHKKIDILINNAGVAKDNLLMRMSEDDWRQVVDVNLGGAYHTIKGAVRSMMKNRSGRIINITSVIGIIGNPGQANYAASKAGLIGLTKSAAKELAGRNITVNAIAPGFIETEMTAGISKEIRDTYKKRIPLGRFGTGTDVANMALFLASDLSSYITGQVFVVDGGMVI
ncbi:MAG: 3-oxoacyl-[acyl-carrier-protein] reductase [Candidatus Cloacimonetes bacterium 4572_55]|nr:MAG: 3-oxoacyl-[acyl-carrier-protein] reductase [Candidatus Cloacimonetes bacterium 4572_55]